MAVPPAGLKAGLEVHQQLDTPEKLFCRCPTRAREPAERTAEFTRLLRPTAGEAGRVDVAALEESRRARKFRYLGYDTTCLVEYDEEPPRELNPEALEVALQAALLLGMAPVEEVHVMRKAVIDGSNTTGFQRTALIATGGAVETPSGRVRLTTLCLEEDAAAIVGQEGDTVIYSLDRLGVPLVEIATEPDLRTPAQARDAARHIGMVLRSTGKVKRGLGTVRQDVNVSIAGGARVEIKGVQELRLVEKVVAEEAERQAKILKLKEAPLARATDAIHIFDSTLTLKGWAPWEWAAGKDFEAIAAKYGCRGSVEMDELDLIVKVDGPRTQEVLPLLASRARRLLEGVPDETRRALEDGSTEFLRPLPGAARMYPETDVHPVLLTPALLGSIRHNLPELLEVKQKRLMERYRLNEELAAVALEHGELFEAWTRQAPQIPPTQVVRALAAWENLQPLLERGPKIAGTLPTIAQRLVEVREAFERLAPPAEWVQRFQPAWAEFERLLPLFRGGSADEARAVVERVVREGAALVREKGEAAHGPLMGLAMKELRGKADGALVARLLKESIAAFLKSA